MHSSSRSGTSEAQRCPTPYAWVQGLSDHRNLSLIRQQTFKTIGGQNPRYPHIQLRITRLAQTLIRPCGQLAKFQRNLFTQRAFNPLMLAFLTTFLTA